MNWINDFKNFFNTIIQLKQLLDKKQQSQALRVFILVVCGALFETLGVAAILPFVQAVMTPDMLRRNKYIQTFCVLCGIDNNITLIVGLGFIIGGVYIFKNIFMLYITYREAKFKGEVVYDLSKLMLNSYLERPYTYFLNTNSAEMMRGVNDDINSINEMITAIFKILSLCLMMIGIGGFIVMQNPIMAMGILGITALIFFLIVVSVKKKTKELGLLKLELGTKVYKNAYQALNGIKEISIMKRESYFLDCYTKVAGEKKKADVIYTCVSACPERIIEAVFICGILGIISMQVVVGNVSGSFVPDLAAFAIGAMRILPSLSTLTTRMTQLIYLKPALNGISDNIEAARIYQEQLVEKQNRNVDNQKKITFKKNILLKNIFWNYPDSKVNVLEDASIDISCGECVAIVGKSGAGKTTLADIILGLLRPKSGQVLVDGIDIYSIPYEWSKLIGYVPQMVYLLDDTIKNNVLFGAAEVDRQDEKIWSALEKAQIKDFVEKLPEQLDTVIGERGVKFSGGQRQRIAIARALYHNPEILIFDEATAALDGETEQAVMDAINALRGTKTLIIIAHRLNTIERCDRVFEVVDGKVLQRTKVE